MHKLALLLCFPVYLSAQPFSPTEVKQWQAQAQAVTIIRDTWGIPHVYGKTDADAVFGLLYAQCEDDFNRVEMNYIEKLGRKAELNGEADLYQDLFTRLLIDSADARQDFDASPAWLKSLCYAFANGINYYLHTHPQVQPALLTRFEPWFPLMWTDGSIGAISSDGLTASDLQNLYSQLTDAQSLVAQLQGWPLPFDQATASLPQRPQPPGYFEVQSSGSNGFALAPRKTASGKAILYINPHTTFYFRPEVQMCSAQGLQAYGAVTWGQFFVYQGFNAHCGWMHTSANVDVSDIYAEKLALNSKAGLQYYHDGQWKAVETKLHHLRYRLPNGDLGQKTITSYATHHGPIMAKINGHAISLQARNRNATSLQQSWLRTKATNYAEFKNAMALCANASNNTVYADDRGNIAYWHGNMVPKRNANLNFSKIMDGTNPDTDWQGLHTLSETVQVQNPQTGYIQNCNSAPFTASGSASPNKANYPAYMAPDGENFRGINAARLLSKGSNFTLSSTIAAGYNRKMTIFEQLLPAMLRAFDQFAPDSMRQQLAGPIAVLRSWNYESADTSIATTLAIGWVEQLPPIIRKVYTNHGETDQVQNVKNLADTASPTLLLGALQRATTKLQQQLGTWQIQWGKLNRFQRLSGSIVQPHADTAVSLAVPYASGLWGMLPAYNSNYFPGTTLRYGIGGNSFVCAVEFGKTVTAKSVLAGGVSGNSKSPHFTDQAERYVQGRFKPVWFYKSDVLKHAKRQYYPGQ